MDKFHSQVILSKDLDQNEEFIVDTKGNVFYPILLVYSVSQSKNKFDSLEFENVNMLITIKPSLTNFFPK